MNHPPNDRALTSVDFDPFASGPLGDWAPTTDPQREILASAFESAEGSAAFNQTLGIRLAGDVDFAALRSALSAVVLRHDALRACFAADGMSFVVAQFDALELVEEDLTVTGAGADAILERYRAVALREAAEPLDLLNGPPVRARLYRLAPDLHYLLLTMHHVVCDGWSLGIILRDLADLYSAAAGGNVAALPPAPCFAQYALDREADRGSAANEAALRFMLERFRRHPPVLDLPHDRPRPPLRTYTADQVSGNIDHETQRALRQLCAKNGVTLLTAMCASFQSFIARLTGVDDVAVVVPAAGQVLHGLHGLVGHCVSAMPVRVTIRLEDSFTAVLAHVNHELVRTQSHQACTFGTLLSHLDLPRDPSRVPLVPVMLTLEREPRPPAFHGLDVTVEPVRNHEAFEWFVHVEDGADRLSVLWTYNTDLFSRDRMVRLLGHYATFLDGLTDGERPVRDVPLLSLAESRALVVDRAGVADAAATDGTMLPWIREQVELHGDRSAVEDDAGNRWSYSELWTAARSVASGLAARGVNPGDVVGVRMKRGAALPGVLLGVLRCGAAYLPLDPDFPAERMAFMVENSGAGIVISDDPSPLGPATLVDPDALLHAPTADVSAHAWPEPRANDLAYVLYTSGSTGHPKGVEVTHGALRNFLGSMRQSPGLSQDDVLLAITTLSFDISGLELFLPLCVGARVCIASKETAGDGHALAARVSSSGATAMQATPASWRMLIDAGWSGPLRKLLCGGEALPEELARTLATCADEVWNLYGPTETTIWSTIERIDGSGPVLVGRPIANTRVYVLDQYGHLLPDGVRGEIWIAGAGVARGYRNRPDLTAERFRDDPFVPGERMYRTGDAGRWRGDRLEHLGRLDFQVKVHGYRIEPGEIESALEALAEVRQAVVAASGLAQDRRLLAYVIFEDGQSLSASEIRAQLGATLPQYMVPGIIVPVMSFALTPNGKVDRMALPDPVAAGLATTRDYAAPVGEVEQAIADVWREVLNVERVSRHDNFFELGGHSLLAVQVAGRLKLQGVALPLRRLMGGDTIAQLAVAPGTRLERAETPIPRLAPALLPVPGLSQERLWTLSHLEDMGSAYHQEIVLRLEGRLGIEALEYALTRLIERHDTLRSCYPSENGMMTVRIAQRPHIALPIEDLTRDATRTTDDALRERINAWNSEPFDLEHGPLFRVLLLRVADDDHVLALGIHHIISDGWSWSVLLRELSALYREHVAGEPAQLAPLPVSYFDFAAWQRQRLAAS